MDGYLKASRRKRRGVLIGVSLLVALLASLTGGYFYITAMLRASLPRLSGTFQAAGLRAPLRIERDEHGVPTVYGSSWHDLAFGLGVVHGQDRFFQMDLLRRKAAGELSALVGKAALEMDKRSRVHRFRARMKEAWDALSRQDQESIRAYVQGVHWALAQGLAEPNAKPFEYALLRTDPQAWQPEDCLLVVCSMYEELQGHQIAIEKLRADVAASFQPEVARFLDPDGTPWDAPIDGSKVAIAPIPSADQLNFRKPARGMAVNREEIIDDQRPIIGSNNWAVAGTHSAHGGAMLADDMHLQLQLPNIWYRVALVWTDPDGTQRRACGVTLPGGPAIVTGSNGFLAWGFTNSQGDWLDLMRVEVNPANPNRYRTADGWKDFTTFREEIQIAGASPYSLEVRETVWGPITDKDRAGRPYALRWVAHQPGAVNLRLAEMLQARTIGETLALTPNCGVPHQNFVCVDRSGKIAWTIIGKIPKRIGANKRSAVPALQQCRWDGFLDGAEYPRVINPEAGRIWTANNRVVGGALWEKVGNGGIDAGLRAGQIRDRLFEKEQMNERDLLAIQLDDEACSFRKWQKLFLEIVPTSASGNPRREELARIVAAWDGHARADSVAYRVLELFRSEVRNSIYEPFRELMRKNAVFTSAGVGLGYMQQQEGPIWALVSARPMHLLSPRFATWQELFLDAADRTARGLQASGKSLDQAVWSDVNCICVHHPLGLAVPLLSCWLDLPPSRLSGARFDLPRVTAPGHGASERFVVSPGKEEQGIFHMPGGQSGHPASPYYTDGYAAWEKGEATPFLPGAKVNELILQPK